METTRLISDVVDKRFVLLVSYSSTIEEPMSVLHCVPSRNERKRCFVVFPSTRCLRSPHTQVIIRMTTTLLKFSLIMVVIILGFATALHVLLRDLDSFGVTLLRLFRAMLSDLDVFDEVSGRRNDGVGTILLVVYLFIVTIMLLNLLVAILSTSHDKVQANVAGQFNVSKARIVHHYEWVVDKDVLPAPFNLVQLPLSVIVRCTFGEGACRDTEGAFGQFVFWLVLGPLAVAGGVLLWVLSALPFPYAQYAWYTYSKEEQTPGWVWRLGRYLIIYAWCLVGAPLSLLFLWAKAFFRVLARPSRNDKSHDDAVRNKKSKTVESLLLDRDDGVGAKELRKFINEPMDDVHVRQDEKDRPTTMEHMKLLRNRLEQTHKDDLQELRRELLDLREELRENLRQVPENVAMAIRSNRQ